MSNTATSVYHMQVFRTPNVHVHTDCPSPDRVLKPLIILALYCGNTKALNKLESTAQCGSLTARVEKSSIEQKNMRFSDAAHILFPWASVSRAAPKSEHGHRRTHAQTGNHKTRALGHSRHDRAETFYAARPNTATKRSSTSGAYFPPHLETGLFSL